MMLMRRPQNLRAASAGMTRTHLWPTSLRSGSSGYLERAGYVVMKRLATGGGGDNPGRRGFEG
jgi:hypothetical protein